MGASLRRIINLSVVIVRACGRSRNHEKAGFGGAVPQRALRGLLDAPLEAGHDNPRGRRGKLKLARKGIINLSVVIVRACGRSSNHGKAGLAGLCLNAPCGGYWMPRLKRGMTTWEVGEESLS
jgi:hypothetical protein